MSTAPRKNESNLSCPSCGKRAENNERFCQKCGHALDISLQAQEEQTEINQYVFGDSTKINSEGFYYEQALQESHPNSKNNILLGPEISNTFQFNFAPNNLRIFAYIFDQILISLLTLFITNLITPFPIDLNVDTYSQSQTQLEQLSEDLSIYFAIFTLLKTLFALLYYYFLESTHSGQTLGMMLLRIRIVDYRFNRTPSKQQILLAVLPKALEIILLFDYFAGRSVHTTPQANETPDLLKNQIRLSQKIARIVVVRL